MPMFCHTHPYPPFIPPNAERLIVGTLPPPRFTLGRLLEDDVNFSYGSRDGQLWPILERLFGVPLRYENSAEAVKERKALLTRNGIGICDIVDRAWRKKIDASDTGMQDAELRDLLEVLRNNAGIKALLFTGGNSKNGPEYYFRKLLKIHGYALEVVSASVPRIHRLTLEGREVYTVSLTAPSGSANRAVGSMAAYKLKKAKDPQYNTIDFRVDQYRPFFTTPFWEWVDG